MSAVPLSSDLKGRAWSDLNGMDGSRMEVKKVQPRLFQMYVGHTQ